MKLIKVTLVAFALLSISSAYAKVDTALSQKLGCGSCHSQSGNMIGPSYDAIYKKYNGQADAANYLFDKTKNGGVGVWGQIPMTPNRHLDDATIKTIVNQILTQ